MKPTPEALRDQLKAAGLRVTAARLQTLEALVAANGPLSHDELALVMARATVDPITIYRSLVAFTRVKLVQRNHGGDRIWRYVLASRAQRHKAAHPHFNCRDCGDTRCLPEVDVRLHGQAEALSANGSPCEVVLTGRCDRCEPAAPASP